MKIHYSKEVAKSLKTKRPVLALESTIIAHGMPYPQNLEFAQLAESICKERGVTPATIAIIGGKVFVGLEKDQINFISKESSVKKVSRRELGIAVSNKWNGATTVSATMHLANLSNIKVFATGGIGGVHRGAKDTFDISEDISALGSIPMVVISAGVKAILDVGLTLEQLETNGITLVGYKTNEFPVFYSRNSGYYDIHQANSAKHIAEIHKNNIDVGIHSALLVANPIPKKDEIPSEKMEKIILGACSIAAGNNVTGKILTPYLLAEIFKKTDGRSLDANRSLALNNVSLGTEIALELYE
tara:strand:- start:1327 stop:2229 length:903 start_codon:yes stop_codon:yes gene_type:complete